MVRSGPGYKGAFTTGRRVVGADIGMGLGPFQQQLPLGPFQQRLPVGPTHPAFAARVRALFGRQAMVQHPYHMAGGI